MFNIESLLLKIQNRRPVVIVMPIVLGLFAGGLLVVKPSLTQLNTLKSDIASLQQKISAYNFVLDGEQKIAESKKHLTGDRTWLIEQMNSIAEKTGVSILSSLPEEPTSVGGGLERTSVRIEAESKYHQLGAFVSQLESLDRYVKIFSVDILTDGGGASQSASGPWQGPGGSRARAQNTGIYKISVSVGILRPVEGAGI